MHQAVEQLPYLHGLDLAHSIMHSSDFEVTVLIGADFYWQIVQDKIIHENGPTAAQLKLGYLLSGPTPSLNSTRDLNVFHAVAQPIDECSTVPKFWEVKSAGILSCHEPPSMDPFLSSYLESSITCKPDGSFIHSEIRGKKITLTYLRIKIFVKDEHNP